MVKKSLLVLLAGVFVMFVSAVAMAQEKAKAGAEPTVAKSKYDKALDKVLADLDLTADQKTKIDGIRESYAAKFKEAKDRTEKAKLRKELNGEVYEALTDTQKPKFEKGLPYKPAKEKKEGEAK